MVIYYAAKTNAKRFRLDEVCLTKEIDSINKLYVSADLSNHYSVGDGYVYGELTMLKVNGSASNVTLDSLKDTELVKVFSIGRFDELTLVLQDGSELLIYTMRGDNK